MKMKVRIIHEDESYFVIATKDSFREVKEQCRHYLMGKTKNRVYISFYFESYRWWGTCKLGDQELTVTRTNDYQYSRGGSHRPNQQIRLDKIAKSTRNRHAKSLY